MAASVNVRLPFTAAQLQELERQSIIFKSIMASIPVPNELLFPITETPSALPPPHSNGNFSFFLRHYIALMLMLILMLLDKLYYVETIFNCEGSLP